MKSMDDSFKTTLTLVAACAKAENYFDLRLGRDDTFNQGQLINSQGIDMELISILIDISKWATCSQSI